MSSEIAENQLAERMRKEWDRRIRHDYRYWMSDGVESDETMWQSGERDLQLLTADLPLALTRTQTALELGCGVGRLLRAASSRFARVIGVDVSEAAVEEATRLLADRSNVEVRLGNGINLSDIADGSIDVAYSFAVLGSLPVRVFAGYLHELSRVVRPGGQVRLQLYLGNEQPTFEEDTIALRSYTREGFRRAVEGAGFSVRVIDELKLPFEISDYEAGVIAELVFMQKDATGFLSPEQLAERLVPNGEQRAGQKWAGSNTEYLMAVARAQQHLGAGEAAAARRALEFAVTYYAEVDSDVRDLLEQLRQLEQNGGVKPSEPRSAHLEQNLAALEARFPELVPQLRATGQSDAISSLVAPGDLPVLAYRGMPLAHREKPVRGGESWAEQVLNTPRYRDTEELIVIGVGSGYHLEALLARTTKRIHVVEPHAEIARALFALRDMRTVIDRIASFSLGSTTVADVIAGLPDRAKAQVVVYPQSQAYAGEALDTIKRALIRERAFEELQPSIGVVGPMYGGSLPIARYVANAFNLLGQRTIGFDLSSFFSSFTNLSGFVRTQARRDVVEGQYVEMLSQMILEAVTERPVDILVCLAQAPLSPRVLTELRNRGIVTVMWFVEDCNRFTTWKSLAPYFDYMFLIQDGEFIKMVEQAGAGRALYLPVGCDPMVHAPAPVTDEERKTFGSQLSFVGAGYNNRCHVFANLARRDFKIWGTEWPKCAPFTKLVQQQGRRVDPSDYVKVFNSTAVNLNLHSSSERDGVDPTGDFVNPRTFELAATGAFQLVDFRRHLPALFDIGPEMAVFHDAREMEEKIDYFLAHPAERAQIATASRARALRDHSYLQRVKSMLEHVYADRFDQLKHRATTSPWGRTLDAAKEFPELESRFQHAFRRGDAAELNSLVADIQTGKGSLTETEQKLLFLHHIKSQINYVRSARKETA